MRSPVQAAPTIPLLINPQILAKARALYSIAVKYAEAGEYRQALKVAEVIEDAYDRTWTLQVLNDITRDFLEGIIGEFE